MSLETAQKVIVPQKKIMSRIFLNSGTLIVIVRKTYSLYHFEQEKSENNALTLVMNNHIIFPILWLPMAPTPISLLRRRTYLQYMLTEEWAGSGWIPPPPLPPPPGKISPSQFGCRLLNSYTQQSPTFRILNALL